MAASGVGTIILLLATILVVGGGRRRLFIFCHSARGIRTGHSKHDKGCEAVYVEIHVEFPNQGCGSQVSSMFVKVI